MIGRCLCFIFSISMVFIFSSQLMAENGRHLFILSGQSNMRPPLPETFKETVAKVFGEDKVLVVMHGRPGQPIKRWYKKWHAPNSTETNENENGNVYNELMDRVKHSIQKVEISSVTLIWMQGEEDARAGWAGVYEESFFGVIEQIKADLKVEKVNFVLGRINDFWLTEKKIVDGDALRLLQVKIGENSKNGAWINTDDLNTGVNPWSQFEFDGGHFPPAGYRVMGQRFAQKACQLLDPAVKVDEKLLNARVFTKASEIATNEAVKKNITGTEADKNFAGLESLLDGKYAGESFDQKQWVTFNPDLKTVELQIDLGEEKVLNSLAFNVLVNSAVNARFPKDIGVAVSSDGKEFKSYGRGGKAIVFSPDAVKQTSAKTFPPAPILLLVELNGTKCRYLKLNINLADAPVLIDEIIVNPQ